MVEFWSIPPEVSREQLGLPESDSDIDAESESIQQEKSVTMEDDDPAGGS